MDQLEEANTPIHQENSAENNRPLPPHEDETYSMADVRKFFDNAKFFAFHEEGSERESEHEAGMKHEIFRLLSRGRSPLEIAHELKNDSAHAITMLRGMGYNDADIQFLLYNEPVRNWRKKASHLLKMRNSRPVSKIA